MANLDALVDSVTAAEPSAPPAPTSAPKAHFDALVGSVTAPDADALHASLVAAQTANPQSEAKRLQQARKIGVDPALVYDDPSEQVRQATINAGSIAAKSPATSKFLSNPNNAKLAIDSVAELQDLEKTSAYGPSRVLNSEEFTARVKEIRAKAPALSWDEARQVALHGTIIDNQATRIGASRAPKGGFENFFTGQLAGIKAVGEQVRQSIRQQVADLFDFSQASDAAAKARRAQFEYSVQRPQYESGAMNDLYTGTENVAQNAPGLAAAIVLKNPQLALAMGTGLTQTLAYSKYRARGGSVGEAQLGAGLEAIIEYGTEMMPMKFLAENVRKIPLWKLAAANQGQEQIQEQIATVSQDFVDFAIANPDKTFGQYLAERPEAARQTAIAVALQSGVVLAAGATQSLLTSTPEVAQRDVNIQKAARADRAFTTLTALTQQAEANPLRQLDSTTFEEFARTMAENPDSIQEVFVSPTVLGEALAANNITAEELRAKVPAVADQLQEGLATGSDVRISMPDYLTYVAPSPVAQAILPHLRVEADGLTYTESQAFFQTQAAEDEKILEKMKEEATPVLTREEFEAQLSAELGLPLQAATPKTPAAPSIIPSAEVPAGVKITIEKQDGGKTLKKQVSAKRAQLAAEQRINRLEALIKCLG